ncbi:MAG: DUF2927 domain-containing protein [Pikeienuella sp.]
MDRAGALFKGVNVSRKSVSSLCRTSLAALGVVTLAACVDSATQYRDYAEQVARQGGLRTVTSAPDAAYTDADLARNFERIAFFTEYTHADGALVQEETPSTLSRWNDEMRVSLLGAGVRSEDWRNLRKLSRRLSNLSGLQMRVGRHADPDISIYIMTEEERTEFGREIEDDERRDDFQILSDWSTQFRYPCVALVGYESEGQGVIDAAIIVIKAELEGVMRQSCIHEELTQAMGLMNDHPDVRPSIFNDDEEFALLTEHDEALLRILYDKRLRPAMTLEEAKPIIPLVVKDAQKAKEQNVELLQANY